MFKKILVALDNSSQAAAVFEFALSIAQAKTSEILLMHFIDWQMEDISPWIGAATLYDLNLSSDRNYGSREYLQVQIEKNKNWLETYAQKAIASNISCQYECRVGNCHLGIGDRAKEWGADLIIMGRRGQKKITEMLLGSVSNYVIHHAPCSILIVQGRQKTEVNELVASGESALTQF